tara:strand:+ start:7926 stop:9731 length:1806 start_codon:yes stop_codon:yes gene_type:complete
MAMTHQQVQGIISTHKTKTRTERTSWDRWRSWYLSEYWRGASEQPQGSGDVLGEEEINFETNYPYAYIDTMIANICPTNPQVSVLAKREELREVAKFREALINNTFTRNQTHRLLWKTATHTAICGRGFLKSVWNFNRDAVEFFSVDPRFIFFDMSAPRWEDIRYLIEVTVLTKAEFKERTRQKKGRGAMYRPKVAEKAEFGGYPTWLTDSVRNQNSVNAASVGVYDWVTVYEVYDFAGEGKYFHVLEGVEEPLFEGELPYRWVRNPFVMLQFNDNMSDLGGMSDVKLISSLQERLNEIDTLELWHAHSSTPVLLVNTGLVDNPETITTALRDASEPGSMVAVMGKADAPLRDLIGQTPTPQFQPSFNRMRDRCTQVIEFVLGIPQYSRGVVGVADVATEVALADTATRTRNGRRIKSVEDLVGQLGDNVIGLYEEFLPNETILPLRLTDSREVLEVTREALRVRDERSSSEGPMDYDYAAVPYSPTENHSLIQLQKVQQYLPLLLESPQVDKEKLILKLLELLQMTDIMQDAPPQPPQMPGMPGMEEMAIMPEAPSEDTLMTGGMPPGVPDQPIPPLPAGGPGAPAPALPGRVQGMLNDN